MFDALFSPVQIGGLTVRNRVYMPAMTTGLGDDEGNVTPQVLDFYTARARGGAGLIVVGGAYSDRRGKGYYGMLAMDRDELVEQHRALVRNIKAHGAAAALQVLDAGRYSSSRVTGLRPVAPSAVPSRLTGETPLEMSAEEIREYERRIADAVRRASLAGYDGAELHAGMGYLISQFLSPLTNRRNDEYGGGLEGRMRFLVEAFEESRRATPKGFLIGVRVSMHDFMEGGNTEREGLEVVRRLDALGADFISVIEGWHESRTPLITQDVPPAGFLWLAELAKGATGRPVIYTTRVKDPGLANRIVEEGKADMVGLGRALLADPEWPEKAMSGRADEIRPCLACSHCLSSLFVRAFQGRPGPVECQVNPRIGRETEGIRAAERRRNVLVIGGGPAGLEVALTLSMRGHQVVLVEREKELGGMVVPAGASAHKSELRELVGYYERMLRKLGVRVMLGSEADQELLGWAEEVVVATGALPKRLPGAVDAVDVLRKGMKLEGNVVVVGGGETGLEVADFLSDMGSRVTVVESRKAGERVELTERGHLFRRLREKGVKVFERTELKEVREGVAVLVDGDGKEIMVPCDHLVNATGMEPNREVLKALQGRSYHMIGDCVEPRRIGDAVREGFELGLRL